MADAIDQALEDLLSGDRRRQAQAHAALMDLTEKPEQREALGRRFMTLAAEEDPMVRGTAFAVLAVTQGAECLSRLERHVSDPEPEVRSDLAHAAALIGPAAKDLLIRLLEDPVLEVRFEAAAGLAEQGEGAGVPVLVQALEVAGLRFQALSALHRVGDERAKDGVRQLFKRFLISGFERTAAAGVLARLGEADARRFLIERIGRRRGDERGLAIELAAELKLTEAAPALERMLSNRKEPFRGAAARALGMLAEERFVEPLATILFDESDDPEARMDAAEGLREGKTQAGRLALEKAKDAVRDPDVLSVVREILGEVRT